MRGTETEAENAPFLRRAFVEDQTHFEFYQIIRTDPVTQRFLNANDEVVVEVHPHITLFQKGVHPWEWGGHVDLQHCWRKTGQ